MTHDELIELAWDEYFSGNNAVLEWNKFDCLSYVVDTYCPDMPLKEYQQLMDKMEAL